MTDLETKLTEHLRQRAEEIEIHEDLHAVIAEMNMVGLTGEDRRPHHPLLVVTVAAVTVAAVVGGIALVRRDDTGPAEPAATSAPRVFASYPVLRGLPAGVRLFNSMGVPYHPPTTKLVIGSASVDGWSDTVVVSAMNDLEAGLNAQGETRRIAGKRVIATDYGSLLWRDNAVWVELFSEGAADHLVGVIGARRTGDATPPDLTVGQLPTGLEVLAGPTAMTDTPFPIVAPSDDSGSVEISVRDDGIANVLNPGDHRFVDINGVQALLSRSEKGSITIVWELDGSTVVLSAARVSEDDAVRIARSSQFVDEATWRATYGDPAVPIVPSSTVGPEPPQSTSPAESPPLLVAGIVRDPEGQPAANIAVVVLVSPSEDEMDSLEPGGSFQMDTVAETRTDDRGRFEVYFDLGSTEPFAGDGFADFEVHAGRGELRGFWGFSRELSADGSLVPLDDQPTFEATVPEGVEEGSTPPGTTSPPLAIESVANGAPYLEMRLEHA